MNGAERFEAYEDDLDGLGGLRDLGDLDDLPGHPGGRAGAWPSGQGGPGSLVGLPGRGGGGPAGPPPDPPDPPVPAAPAALEHGVLRSLLGAWALAACPAPEAAAVEEHLRGCGACADEARRLRGAVGLLRPPESLDLDPALRARVLDGCLERRPPRVPVPAWAKPYDAETARLDALLQDFGDAEWHAPVRLPRPHPGGAAARRTTVAGVVARLLAADGTVAVALGLPGPSGPDRAPAAAAPPARAGAYGRTVRFPPTRSVREPWREQAHAVVRTVSSTGDTGDTGGRTPVPYGGLTLSLRDAVLHRAFACWAHAEDIADAVDYPYAAPAPDHLHRMIDLTARLLPGALAARRRAGTAAPGPRRHLVAAGGPGRSLRLEIEGSGGGEWLIALDSPGAMGSADHEVAHAVLDGTEFCRLAAGRLAPEDAAVGRSGDREAIRDVLLAAASLGRM
ncbi:MDMPI N domain containing protein [Streptomyces sp. PRKS01-65]|nr:zf-HC2 domain-containing protein [Streptomyces harenosi]NEY34887.1 MDMPI N domain containing protein [Streptomyces harenosi]